MDWIAIAVAAVITGNVMQVDGGSGGGGLTIDLLNLQWWQTFLAVLAAAGFSPAPWILGLATGKIQFTARADEVYEKRVTEITEHHDAIIAIKDRERDALEAAKDERYADLERTAEKNERAAQIEKERADAANAALAESTEVVKMAGRIIQEIREAAQEVSTGGA